MDLRHMQAESYHNELLPKKEALQHLQNELEVGDCAGLHRSVR
jgi:hypothetical protein